MPPLAISEHQLRRLVSITASAIAQVGAQAATVAAA
jgi:adenosylmethionine-8-amino-7-oxononanoate aminotransferase